MAEKEILFRRKVVYLRLNEDIRPQWIGSEEKIPVFLDEAYSVAPGTKELASLEHDGIRFTACTEKPDGVEFAFDIDKAISDIAGEIYLSGRKPLTSRLWFNYQRIPAGFRAMAARTLCLGGRIDRNGIGFPDWPVDKSIEVLRYLKNTALRVTKDSPWPDGKKFAFCVSHDLESGHSLKDLRRLVDTDKSFGFKGCWNIVATLMESRGECAENLKSAGYEIGCHGYNHDNKFAFLPEEKMRARLEKCASYIDRYQIKGFRSPSLLRSPGLMRQLADYFEYDSSYPDTDIFSETGERNGCCEIRPFFINGMIELPITMPMDSSMLFAGYDHEEMLQIWLRKLGWLKERQGMALINVHCHRPFSLNGKVYDAYAKLLEIVAKDRDCWVASCGDIAEYWRGTKEGYSN